MSMSDNFINYFNHLINYQNKLLPDNKLNRDYIIIYEYLMDLLEKDEIIGKFLVRQKQQNSHLNADILLDLTKLFSTRSYIHEPFLCLTLEGLDNKNVEKNLHPFCNKKLSIVSRKVTKSIWLAFYNGLLQSGSFVRGFQGDIYELTLSSEEYNGSFVRINAYNVDISININLRILLKYTTNSKNELSKFKPYPAHALKKEWFAMAPSRLCSMFKVCFPKLEYELKHVCFKLVHIFRLLRFLFQNHKKLKILDTGFLEEIIYIEFMEKLRNLKECKRGYYYLFKGVLSRLYWALKKKQTPCVWNSHLNFMKYFDRDMDNRAFQELNNVFNKFRTLEHSNSLKYEDFFEVFDFKMEPFSYEVDQFGIFKSY